MMKIKANRIFLLQDWRHYLSPIFFIALAFSLLLSGCASTDDKRPLPNLAYQERVRAYAQKDLLLAWEGGDVILPTTSTNYQGVTGLGIAGALASVIGASIASKEDNILNSNQHRTKASQFDYRDQAIFMHSLADMFNNNHAFKSVHFTSDIKHLKPSQIGILVNFKLSRSDHRQLFLDVALLIKDRGRAKKSVFFIKSDELGKEGRAKSLLQSKEWVARALAHRIVKSTNQFLNKQ